MKVVAYVIATIIGLTLSYLYSAWALTILWGWFIVPTFHLTPLTVGMALGLIVVVNFLKITVNLSDKHEHQPYFVILLAGYFWTIYLPTITLAIGWIIHTIFFLP